MVYTVKLPRLGEGIFEAQVVNLFAKEGNQVNEDDILADMQTDKAAGELQSPVDGTIQDIMVKEGQVIYQGDPLILIDDGSNKPPDLKNNVGKVYQGPSKKSTVVKTEASRENKNGQRMKKGNYKRKSRPKIKAPSRLEPDNNNQTNGSDESIKEKSEYHSDFRLTMFEQNKHNDSIIFAMPKVRQYAKEKGVDMKEIKDKKEPIKQSQVDELIQKHQIEEVPSQYQIIDQNDPEIVSSNPDEEDWVEVNYIRKFNESSYEMQHKLVPPFTLFETIDAFPLLDFVDRVGAESYLPIIMKALVVTAKKYPRLNGSIENRTANYIYKNYYNIGFDVNTAQGMFTPVVQQADKMSIEALDEKIISLRKDILNRKFEWENLSEGTMTITDNSDLEVEVGYFTPIIHYPQVTCLGLGSIQEKPVVYEGEVVPQTSLPISLTVDYRMVDRSDAAKALAYFKELIENPNQLIGKM